MNAPAPGWNADPTGRHEYRYWDGSAWTGDVSDSGVTSVDPLDGAGAPGGDPTAVVDATHQYGTQPGIPGGPAAGYGQGYGSGPVPPGQPAKSGPSTGLIVGLAALAVALVAGIAFLVTSGGDDDDTATGDESPTAGQAGDDSSADDAAGDDTSGDLGSDGGFGGAGEDAIIDMMATEIVNGSGGQISQEQAECAAQAMIDTIGVESLAEIGASGDDPFTALGSEDGQAIFDAITDCIPLDVLMEMGTDTGG